MKSKLHINTLAMAIAFSINIIISLFISPIIIECVGSEAYAFLKMATDFTNYASIISIALNSVGNRFIGVSYHRGDKEDAQEYFNSVLWGNFLLSLFFLLLGSCVILFLEKIINISDYLILDVKLLFSFVFINFIISIICSIFSIATYVTNRLYLSSIVNACASIFKIIVIIVLFEIYTPRVWILGVACCIHSIIVGYFNNLFRKKYTPDLKIEYKLFSGKKIFQMLKSGVWSSVSSLSNTLSDGLDLLVSNLFVSSVVMGQLSIAKTVISLIVSLIGQITNLFSPNFTKYYAEGQVDKLEKEVHFSMKYAGFICCIFTSVFLTLGKNFFDLWVPSQDTEYIYILSILSIMSLLTSGVTAPLNNVFVLTNHLKLNSLIWLCASLFDIACVFVLLKFTNLGGLAIAGVSSVVGMILNITYLPYTASKYLEISLRKIYEIIGRYIVGFLFGLLESFGINKFMNIKIYTWNILIFEGILLIGIVSISNYFVLLNRGERVLLKGVLKRMVSSIGRNNNSN